MAIITSKRHPLRFYAFIIFCFLFLSGLATLLMFTAIEELRDGATETKEIILPLLCTLFYLLAFSIVIVYRRNTPIITINKHSIKVGDQNFYLKDIEDIALTGKMPFRFILRFPMEGTAILFKDRTVIYFFDELYTNSPEIKSYLEQVILNKQEYKPIAEKEIKQRDLQLEREEHFKGSHLFSMRGISCWGPIAFFTVMLLTKWQSSSIAIYVFVPIFSFGWISLHAWLMHYFGVTKDYLIIRNHILFWMTKIYPLSGIKEVVFETKGKQPNSMRVITNDFKSKLFPAGTLRDKTWLEMKDRLEEKGITVRNECI